jgi:hypothetical protein
MCGSLDVSEPYGSPWPLAGIALLSHLEETPRGVGQLLTYCLVTALSYETNSFFGNSEDEKPYQIVIMTLIWEIIKMFLLTNENA